MYTARDVGADIDIWLIYSEFQSWLSLNVCHLGEEDITWILFMRLNLGPGRNFVSRLSHAAAPDYLPTPTHRGRRGATISIAGRILVWWGWLWWLVWFHWLDAARWGREQWPFTAPGRSRQWHRCFAFPSVFSACSKGRCAAQTLWNFTLGDVLGQEGKTEGLQQTDW